MAGRIKGITIEIGGETTGLQNALKDVNKRSGELSKELKDIERLLKFNPGNVEALAQKQQLLTQQIENTTKKLDSLKSAQQQVQAQFESGAINEEQYRAFRREIELTEGQLNGFKNSLAGLKAEQEKAASSTRQLETLFSTTGKSVDDFADALGNRLVNAIKNGTASSRQLEQAIEIIGREALGTEADIEKLQQALRSVDDGNSIQNIRNDLNQLSQDADQTGESVKELGIELENVLSGIVAGGGIQEVIGQALDMSELKTKIDITFDVPESSKRSVEDAIRTVTAYGGDAEEALEGVRRQWSLNKDASDAANREIVKGAANISSSYSQIDFTELIQETNEIGSELNISNKEALGLVNSLLKIGFPPEQLDIIAEYGAQLRRVGYTAQEVQSIMASAAKEKSWNIDNLLDGLKEGRIRSVEMSRGLSNSMKDAVRDAVDDTEKMSDAQISAMQKGFAKQESALANSFSNQEKALSKSHSQRQNALAKSLDAEYNAVSKSYENQQKNLEKKLSAEYDAASKNYDRQQKALEKSLEAEVKAFEKSSEQKLKLIDKEYMERMKLIDEEKYNRLKAVDDQINSLDAKTAAEDKYFKDRENAEKRADLKVKISKAKNEEERQAAIKALQELEEKMRLDKIREERKSQIDRLKEEKDGIKEASDAKKEALKSEIDSRKEQVKEQINNEKEALKERQQEQKEAFQQSKQENLKAISESNKAQLDSLREVNQANLSALKENHNDRKQVLSERLSDEMDAVRESHRAELESFKEMNAQKLELAKNPPDSAAVQEIFAQLEGWGKAIAKGGEEGKQAFVDMVKWLDQIQDADLKEAIGVELFGTMWEDQGQKIINTILQTEQKQADLKQGIDDLQQSVSKTDASPMVKLKEAMNDLKEALEPVLLTVAEMVSKIAEFISAHPVLAAAITGIVTVLGIVLGLCAALAPLLLLITTQTLTWAGVMAVLTSPITLVVAAIAGLIAIWVLFGDKIMAIYNEYFKPTIDQIVSIITETLQPVFDKGFTIIKDIVKDAFDIIKRVWEEILSPVFSKISSFIENVLLPAFKFVFSVIGSVVSDAFDGIKVVWDTVLKPILNGIIDFISGAFSGDWDKAWKGIVEIFDGVFNGIELAAKAPINAVISMINALIEGINSIDMPDWVPFVGGGKTHIPTIPMLATGGHVLGDGSFIAGEAGPELFTKRGNRVSVTPLSSNEKSLGITGTMSRLIGDMSYSMASSMKELSGLKSVMSNVYGSMASSTQAMSQSASQSSADGNSNNSNGNISYNFERMFEGATFPIREEADIKKIAVELGKYIKTSGRRVGQS
ncbi:tape measure protein [Bacillus cereus]|uniref:tape measure protein n=1 Tax=Bacillus TaxID=1386 RepID=UPI000A37F29B|nr:MULTISPECIES: tape measure protein [Bacillus]MEB8740481.1 tape measure protein [Bacillus cereus]MEB8906712.1 tape measure protein [Bacillus cereus]MEB9922352.1 tape measure protein [Bacillus cereus]MEB9983186.1 tape measure protein [Bacillus cereus]MEB9988119.1 tape measure protein [Bacillus cereus]